MKKSIFKSFSFWLILVSFIISLFVIFIMPLLSDSFTDLSFRLLIAFSIFFGTIIIILLSILLKKEETKEIIKEKKEQRELEEQYKQVINEKVKDLKSKFKEATKIIKKSSLYKNKRKAKYELPWYLVLGNSNEGKTTLLESSGLEFPLNIDYSKKEILEEKSSNSFEWYFTEQSVFIDVPGNYIEQTKNPEDGVVWKEFLKLFSKKRWKRPINGVILTISTEMLLEKTEKQIEQYAKDLRDRFDELSDSFMSNIPIYLLVSKCDKIVGFNEYFASVTNDEKDEILGVTFDNKNKNIDTSIVKPEFESLLKRINSSVLDKIHYEWDEVQRSRIFLFSDNLSEVFDRSNLFINICFSQTRYRTPLKLRGVYFTSVPGEKQDGYSLPHKNSNLDNARSSTKGLFIKKVLKDIIFPESNIISVDDNYKNRTRRNEYFAYILSFVFVAFMFFFFIKDFLETNNQIIELEENIKIYNKHKKVITKKDNFIQTINTLEELYSIRKAEESVGKDSFWNLLFYKVDDRNDTLKELYYKDLEKLLLPKVGEEIERNIRKELNDFDKTWDNTKAYIMLKNKKRRDKEYLKTFMQNKWKTLYSRNDKLQERLNFHWNNLLTKGFNSYEINKRSLKLARKRLNKLSSKVLTYQGLKTKFEHMQLNDFSFSQVLSTNISSFTGTDYTISGFYTKEGYSKLLKEGRLLTKEILLDNWVIGNRTNLSIAEIDDFYQDIIKFYFRDYKKYWLYALSKVKVKPVNSVSGLNKQLEMLSSIDSPTLSILKALKENTELYSASESIKSNTNSEIKNAAINKVASGQLTRAISKKAIGKISNNIDNNSAKNLRNFFAPYNKLTHKDYQPRGALKSAIEKVIRAYETMSSVSSAIAPRRNAFNLVVDRVKGRGEPIVANLGSIPSDVKKWYQVPLKGNWNLILKSAKLYIDSKYKEEVYTFYKERLKGKYPIYKKESNNFIKIDDFTEFFGANGIMDKFYKNYISNFVKISTNYQSYEFKNLDGHTIGLEREFIQAILKAYQIKKVFFRNDGNLELVTSIKPYDLSSNIATMELSYDDQIIYYEHGPIQSRKIVWPTQTLNNNIKFSLYDLNSNIVTQEYIDNDWSLFKIIDKFKVKQANNNSIIITYDYNNYNGAFLLKGPITKLFGKYSPLSTFYLNEGL